MQSTISTIHLTVKIFCCECDGKQSTTVRQSLQYSWKQMLSRYFFCNTKRYSPNRRYDWIGLELVGIMGWLARLAAKNNANPSRRQTTKRRRVTDGTRPHPPYTHTSTKKTNAPTKSKSPKEELPPSTKNLLATTHGIAPPTGDTREGSQRARVW